MGDPPPKTGPTHAMGMRLGSGGPCSQEMCTVPLRQGLQSRHRKRLSSKDSWYWFFLQPHTVFWFTMQGEISTWSISGEGKSWGRSLSQWHAFLPTHTLYLTGTRISARTQQHRHAHPSPCPPGPSYLEPLLSPETHLSGIWSRGGIV